MRNKKFLPLLIGFFLTVVLLCVFVLKSQHALVVQPKGLIAHSALRLITTNFLLMLAIIVPTYILLFSVVWKYCVNKETLKETTEHEPEHNPHKVSSLGQLLMWLLPSIVVAVMAVVLWNATHELDPYKPIESDVKPLSVQIVALNWKWLFIYPELGIATLNTFHLPEATPIHLKLAADASPMNSFWIPELSGQIYAMTGMSTQMYIMADKPGNYSGKAVEINGEGYADMNFPVTSSTLQDFEAWVAEVKKSPLRLMQEEYDQLLKPAIQSSIVLFSEVEPDLYHNIVHKYMYPTKPVL